VVWIKLAKVMSKRLYFVSMFQEDSAIWVLLNRSLAVKKKARGVKHRVREVVCVCVCVCVHVPTANCSKWREG
jgi:hypothetical protein